jgi:hypothetical protein
MGGGKTQVVQAPAAPNYQESMRSILQAQIDLAPQVYASEEIYQPKYQALQDQIARQAAQSQIGMYQQLQPAYSQLEEDYMKSQQAAQLRGLQERAPEYIQAFQQAQGVGGINQALQKYTEQKLGGLQANGANLSPEEQRMLDQQARAGYAARGTSLGGQSNLAEVMNRYNARQAREQQLVALGTGLGGYFQQQSAPALTSFYQQPMYAGSFGGQAAQNAMMGQQQAGPQYFNPESQTGMGSIYGAYNAQMQLAAGTAQARAAERAGRSAMWGSIIGGGLGAAGTLGGAGILKCWVAREVYGRMNPDWLTFREWMVNEAPEWLRNAYIKYGQQFADFIKDKPRVKWFIKLWMDSKIKR